MVQMPKEEAGKSSSEAALSKELEGHPYTGIAHFVLLGFLGGIRMVLSHM